MTSVFLATPAYDGHVVPAFRESLERSLRVLQDAGIPAHWETLSGCCYLPIARNKLVRTFLESDATDFVFIDADVEWEPDDLVRLLSHPVEIVGGAYRHKTWEETYPIWWRTDAEQRPMMAGLSDLIECWSIPTGFMRLTRSVFDAMKRHYGEELEVDEYTQDAQPMGMYLNFFDTGRIGRQWWGEDCNFCRRWTMEMHRKLYIDPTVNVTHWGKSPLGGDQPFKGDFSDYLSRKPGGMNDPGYYGCDIGGYLVIREGQWLYTQARRMDSVLEVGSFLGRSAHALLSGCKGTVTCVDPWGVLPWVEGDNETAAEERFLKFLANTDGIGNLIVKRMSSTEAAAQYQDQSIDMVFIDGDHSGESVAEDIDTWLPKARRVLCGHDYNSYGWPGVKAVVDKVFGSRVKSVETIWYVDIS